MRKRNTTSADNPGEAVPAQQLERFYDLLRLLEAQLKDSTEILRKQIASLLSLRGAWTEVERVTITEPASAQSPAISANNATPDFPRQALLVDWKT